MQGLITYADSFLGQPYIYGAPEWVQNGRDFPAWDCSGYVQEVLKSVGIDPKGDQSSQAYYDYFRKNGRVYYANQIPLNKDALAALVFFGKGHDSISHIGFITNLSPLRMNEAGGGNSETTTMEEAIKRNAFVRKRLVSSRRDLIAIIRPHYSGVGLLL